MRLNYNNIFHRWLTRKIFSSLYSSIVPYRGVYYKENLEFGIGNISVKFERMKQGEPFEYLNEIATNRAIEKCIKKERNIIDYGSGTGLFESFAAPKHPHTHFVASELDTETTKWCKQNRGYKNVEYVSLDTKQLLKKYGEFDLAVCVEVIEHVTDYQQFLEELTSLSDTAIITTPNRDRDITEAMSISPTIHYHVREWNAGEFYWILRAYYKKVDLFSITDPEGTNIQRVGFMHSLFGTIAYCSGRIRF